MNAIVQPRLEMWFDFASPYSYLAMERIHALAEPAGVRVALRPFLLGPIFRDFGWDETPFRLFPRKGAYMMRDVARLADKYGLPFRRPTEFPRVGVAATRIALLGQDEPWGAAFCREVFRENFQHDRDLQPAEALAPLLARLELPAGLIERAGGDEARQALRRQVDRARERGVFGAPTFFADDEMFWGNDRLEDALEWARGNASPHA